MAAVNGVKLITVSAVQSMRDQNIPILVAFARVKTVKESWKSLVLVSLYFYRSN